MVYILVNPKLSNSNINSKKKNQNDAAEDIWTQLTKNIKNYTPKFYFTIQEGGTNKLYHYLIKESIKNKEVQYHIERYNSKNIDDKSLLKELKQSGGTNKDDSSSSDSSSDSSSSLDDESENKSEDDSSKENNKKKNKLKQLGGKKKYDSTSSSSSEEELLFTFPNRKHKNLLNLTYYPTIYGVQNVILPTFATSYAQYVTISLLPNYRLIAMTP